VIIEVCATEIIKITSVSYFGSALASHIGIAHQASASSVSQ